MVLQDECFYELLVNMDPVVNPLPEKKDKILDWSKLKQVVDNILKGI